MTNFETLDVTERNTHTQAEITSLRKNGIIPGIVYGAKKSPKMVSINRLLLEKIISNRGALSKVFIVDNEQVVIRDVQFHCVNCNPIHVDFMRVPSDKIKVKVPVICKNESLSPALKKGGVLSILVREIDISCSPDNIPESIMVDMTGINFHQTIRVSDLPLPKGSKIITKLPKNAAIVTIVAPSGLRSEIGKESEATTEAATESTTAPAAAASVKTDK